MNVKQRESKNGKKRMGKKQGEEELIAKSS